jgi:maltooligosyltrehalose trehalohydrolase
MAGQRAHSMPFGAEVLQEGGGVRFSLWAPGVRQVDLCINDNILPMDFLGDGWFQLIVYEAGPGTLYMYIIEGELKVPDPASRYQPADVHGPSEVVAPLSFEWEDAGWKGRSWEETVLYELHVGAFSPLGTFKGVCSRLDYLIDLGVTAIELMPVADFPGKRNWGYDGVLLFAPDSCYGRPEDLKALVQTAHQKGLTVFLDVVYNHFGPEGNYLHAYARDAFFTGRHQTLWGDAINFDGENSGTVRDFFVHNALYWLEEYHIDGLRLDAVHAIRDDSRPDILEELAEVVWQDLGGDRQVHLLLENDDNAARYLRRDSKGQPRWYTAQWNDDIHHAVHCLLTGESEGYYCDYADYPAVHLGRCLAEGFAYQGEPSRYRNGASRGEPSQGLPPTAFVSFLQNHDQVGNRAFGERITNLAGEQAIRAALSVLLLAPSPPLLFMGEEFGCRQPFPFFCDFGPELAASVSQGRSKEFAKFMAFREPSAREHIPDPNDLETFESAILNWDCLNQPVHREWLCFYKRLLALRRQKILPLLRGMGIQGSRFRLLGPRTVATEWSLDAGATLILLANLGDERTICPEGREGTLIFQTGTVPKELAQGFLPPWYVGWFLNNLSLHHL